MPWWLSGLLIDGMYLATAWVVSVMLPPMAIFFPLFTLLEDFGYLPRVSFNLDNAFRKAGAHGKQSLSMMMGFGCNAAGVIATRVIDSPRERLIAIITNNFALCNGRWPTQILIATLFIGVLAPAYLAGLVSALAVVGIAVLGVLLTFAVSWGLSRTMLQGEVSTFSLELPPYRPPQILRTIGTSFVDRTLYVLWRAIVFAMPAGAVIWLISNSFLRRHEYRRIYDQFPESARPPDWPERHHPRGLYRGHPSQRDRHTHHPDVNCAGHGHQCRRRCRRVCSSWIRWHETKAILVAGGFTLAHGHQPDALLVDPQSLFDNHFHHLQRNGQQALGGRFRSSAAGDGIRRHLCRRPTVAHIHRSWLNRLCQNWSNFRHWTQ